MSTRPTNKIDYLIRLGLVSDQDKLTWYHKVFTEPKKAVKDFNLRPYVGETLDGLLNLVFSDDMIYNRIKTLLTRRKMRDTPHNMTEDALKSLMEKTIEFDVPLDILIDVYQRGFMEEGRNISPDQNGFNRVNSFVSGGRALELDRDLLDEHYSREIVEKRMPSPTRNTLSRIMKHSVSNPDKIIKPKKKPKK